MLLFSGFFTGFSLSLVFCSSNMICLCVCVLYLYCFVLPELPRCSLLSVINFGKFSAVIISKISSALFSLFSFWYFSYTHYIFWSLPSSWRTFWFSFLKWFFPFCFNSESFCMTYLQAHWFLCCFESTDESTEGILHITCSGFDFQHFLFTLSISRLTLLICVFLFSILSIRALIIFVIVIPNTLPFKSNIFVTSESGCYAYFVSSDCFACFSASLVFFKLKSWICCMVNRDWGKRPLFWRFMLVWLGVGLGVCFL